MSEEKKKLQDFEVARAVAGRLRESLPIARAQGKPVGLDYTFAERLADLLERLADRVEEASADSGTW